MPDLPTGTITFLFTDIEGSTRLWERHPRAMQAAIALHDALLREVIESNGGYVFKTVGDAFCAAFPTAPEALSAALDAQHAIAAADWSAISDPMKVRMALHTGAAETRDRDYFGLPLNRVARLLSTGYGGQILLSLATQQLVRDHLPPDTDLRDLGEGTLKDLIRPEHIYQVIAPNLPTDFPPLKSLDPTSSEPITEDGSGLRNPYKGLRAFQEADANDFFGRENLTERLLARLREPEGEEGGKEEADTDATRFLAVVGPSGSGKSSAVRAGLVPALRVGAHGHAPLPGSDRWLVVEMLPGAHPLEELEAVLLSIAVNPPESLINQLREDERGLLRAVKRVLPRDETVELLLVIDQFEEVFTLTQDEAERVHFLDSLLVAVTDPRSRLHVIITLRADFYDRPLLYPGFGELVRQRTEIVLPLAADELERAIVRPARRVSVNLEAELVAAIIQDIGEQPGALPLLQYALTELFEQRAGRLMTLEAYRANGGVLGALGKRAEEIYSQLNEAEQEAARQLFLRLVTLGEGVEDTRRRARMAELESLTKDAQPLTQVIEAYGRHRLLTFDRDPITHGPTIEVAHEALLRTWARLREWLEASRANLRVQRQLMAASTEWASAGQDSSFLASGARLAQFEALAASGDLALNQEEQAYLQASVAERDRQEAAERERQTRELALQKRAARRLRYLVVGLGLFLVVALILTGFAFSQKQEAQSNLAQSESRRLVGIAKSILQAGGPLEQGSAEFAALFSIKALNIAYSPDADAALEQASEYAFESRSFSSKQPRNLSEYAWINVAFSPDRKSIVTCCKRNSGEIDLRNVRNRDVIRQLSKTQSNPTFRNPIFSPDGRYVLGRIRTSQSDDDVALWDAQTGKELYGFSGISDKGQTIYVTSISFSPDSRYALVLYDNGMIRKWDTQTAKESDQYKILPHPGTADGNYFSSDGRYILQFPSEGSISDAPPYFYRMTVLRLFDAQTGKELRQFSIQGKVIRAVLSPDHQYIGIAIEYANNLYSIVLLDTQTGVETHQLIDHQKTSYREQIALIFSPNGKYIVTAFPGEQNLAAVSVWLWETQTGKKVRQLTDKGVNSYNVYDKQSFSTDGKYVLVFEEGEEQKSASVWRLAEVEPVRPPAFAGHTSMITTVTFSQDGKYMLTGSKDKTARLWDAQTGSELRQFTGHTDSLFSLAISPDNKQIVTASNDNTIRLWDAETGVELHRFTAFTEITRTNTLSGQVVAADVVTYTASVRQVAFSNDGKYVLAAGFTNKSKRSIGDAGDIMGDIMTRLWDAQTGKELPRPIIGDLGEYKAVSSIPQFSGDPSRFFRELAMSSGHRTYLDPISGQDNDTYANMESDVDIAFSSQGKYVYYDGSTKDKTRSDIARDVWDIHVPLVQYYPVIQVKSSSDSVIDSRTLTFVTSVTFSPDSKYVLMGSSQGPAAYLWEVPVQDTPLTLDFSRSHEERKELRRFSGHTDKIRNVAISPDNKYVLTGSDDKTARLWDLATGRQLRVFAAPDKVSIVSFTPDGKKVLVGTDNGKLSLWDVDYHDLIKSVCSRIAIDFTDEERALYNIPDKQPTCP